MLYLVDHVSQYVRPGKAFGREDSNIGADIITQLCYFGRT